jgi:hypothetical protein
MLISVLRKRVACAGWLLLGSVQGALAATPSLQGQSGYINMPSALVEADGSFSSGYSYDAPYGGFWITATILPFLQTTARFVSVTGITGFSDPVRAQSYGRYKDKVFDAKLRLNEEGKWMPQFAIGATDLQGTQLFRGSYLVATKHFGEFNRLETSLGVGRSRPDGPFAAARFTPGAFPRWSLVAEYDANNYQNDFRAAESFAGQRRKGPATGIEYRWGWLGVQAARHREHNSINAWVSIPFGDREFVPKFAEPAYYTEGSPRRRPSKQEWRSDPGYGKALVAALARQDYKNIRIDLRGHMLHISLGNSRISNTGRAAGRAVRTALYFAPSDIRGIQLDYTIQEQPVVSYEFFDLPRLNDYLNGKISRRQFLDYVLIRWSALSDRIEESRDGMLTGIADDTGLSLFVGRDGEVVQLHASDSEANRIRLAPKMSLFFNDPSGALRYEVAAFANYDKRLGSGLYLNSALSLTLYETISEVTQASNSQLPHVRSDIALYKRGSRLKLQRLLLNQYWQPGEGVYARASAGLYEEMYRGGGGQLLYWPKASRWAADLAVDALQQRDYQGFFGKLDYQTVTAIASLHYRLPLGMTVTGRAGRFLAKDTGVRAEFKRRFDSGIEIGAWYTVTNGNDITSPGTPGSPYHDKGIFLSVPLNSMLPSDTLAHAGFALAPWTRDVGQMVLSPGDLYAQLERPRRDAASSDGLGNFAERADEANSPAVHPPMEPLGNPWPLFQERRRSSARALPDGEDFLRGVAVGAGAVLAASLVDKQFDKLMSQHAGSSLVQAWDKAGKALPVLAVGAAGASMLLGDERISNTGFIALQSALLAGAASMAIKPLVARARPLEDQGNWARSSDRSDASFPSNHATVSFAAVTPFAKELDAPWLYGVAGIASLGRAAARQHWASDVLGGGLLGYAVGSWLWEGQRKNRGYFSVTPSGKEVAVSWNAQY